MNRYNEQYYIIFHEYNGNTLYLSSQDRSDLRAYQYTKLEFGEPLFFENAYKKEDAIKRICRPIRQAHLNITYPIITDEIKEALGDIENEQFQFYPAVIVDDNGYYHDNLWLFNVFNKLDILDLDKCEIKKFNPNNTTHSISKYYLNEEKITAIPEDFRLIFKPKYSNISHIIVHEKVVNVFRKFNVDTLRFIKISDWEMGDQFVKAN